MLAPQVWGSCDDSPPTTRELQGEITYLRTHKSDRRVAIETDIFFEVECSVSVLLSLVLMLRRRADELFLQVLRHLLFSLLAFLFLDRFLVFLSTISMIQETRDLAYPLGILVLKPLSPWGPLFESRLIIAIFTAAITRLARVRGASSYSILSIRFIA